MSSMMASTTLHSCRRLPMVLCFLLATIASSQCFAPLFIYLFFPSFLWATKAISTIGFVLTITNVFFDAMVYLWVYYCSCLFTGLQIGLLALLRFVALLAPLGCATCGALYQTTLIGDHFYWCSYQENIGTRHLFDAFPFNLFLPSLMRLIWGSLLGCPALCFYLL
jgi:hypothetical protein